MRKAGTQRRSASRIRDAGIGTVPLLALWALLACGTAERPPSLVLVLVDDLGWQDLGAMGHPYHETPHVDRLAAEGVTFTQAYAAGPNCAPSRESILTGQLPVRHGFYAARPAEAGALRPVRNRTRPAAAYRSLAEVLSAQGYRTGHFGKWHRRDEPADHGFGRVVRRDDLGFEKSQHLRTLPDGDSELLVDALTEQALAFVEESSGEPFFVHLAHHAVHLPHQARPAGVEHFAAKACPLPRCDPTYAAMLREVDASVGRLVEGLDALGRTDDTLVVVSSDNGGGLAGFVRPLRGGKATLYEGGVRVPLIVRWPAGIVGTGRESDVPVIGVDWFPTLLELIASEPPPEHPLDGRSLLPLLRNETFAERSLFWHLPLYTGRSKPAGAVRSGRFKLIEHFENERVELYDLAEDPGERVDLAGTRPELRDRLLSELESWRASTDAPMPQPRGDAADAPTH